ncbi:MAG: IS3 family transposase [Oscillochloris sp.]|nr:IS3 family transposase [Oscillochloris sp.]
MLAGAQELAPQVGVAAACAALGVPRSSFYQAHQPPPAPVAPQARPRPRQALSPAEEQRIRAILNSERFVDQAPRSIYATLLDEGIHLCSWRTMYRILKQDAATRERRAQHRRPAYTAPELLATAPCQVWSWDITKLRGPTPGLWYNLYVILDIFSRKIVGWLIEHREDALLAEALIAESYTREGVLPHQLTLHADRGAPMKSKTVAELLIDLGVAQSHSRPTISDDNPYSESQFKTLKYGPTYPERFASLEAARSWMRRFVEWYNHEHKHSGIAKALDTFRGGLGLAVNLGQNRCERVGEPAVDDQARDVPLEGVQGGEHAAQVVGPLHRQESCVGGEEVDRAGLVASTV